MLCHYVVAEFCCFDVSVWVCFDVGLFYAVVFVILCVLE